MSDSTPSLTLSLAIPNRNGARFLAHTLRSLNEQDAPVHWWLEDAQSSDESLELARALARPGDTIRCETDKGQADALNKAFAKMGGDIVGFINSDDGLLPGAARRVLEEFQKHPEIDIVVGGVQFIDAFGEPQKLHYGRIESLEEMLDLYSVWWKERQFVQPEVFWRRSLWDKVGPFDTRYNLAFDYDYWLRCFRAGARVQHIHQPLAEFRLHPNQKSTAATAAANELRDILQRALEQPSLPVDSLFRWRLQQRLQYDRYQSGQDNAPDGWRDPFWKKLLTHPGWLTVPEVQQRLLTSMRRQWARPAA